MRAYVLVALGAVSLQASAQDMLDPAADQGVQEYACSKFPGGCTPAEVRFYRCRVTPASCVDNPTPEAVQAATAAAVKRACWARDRYCGAYDPPRKSVQLKLSSMDSFPVEVKGRAQGAAGWPSLPSIKPQDRLGQPLPPASLFAGGFAARSTATHGPHGQPRAAQVHEAAKAPAPAPAKPVAARSRGSQRTRNITSAVSASELLY